MINSNFDQNTQMYLSTNIEIYPNEIQIKRLDEFIYVSNYVYDIVIDLCKSAYIDYMNDNTQYKNVSKFDIQKYIRELRHNDQILSNVPYHICACAINRAINAYSMFCKGLCNEPKKHIPDNITSSFEVRADSFYIENSQVTMEGFSNKPIHGFCYGSIKCQNIGFNKNDKFYGINICKNNFGYYISLSRIVDRNSFEYPKSRPIGVDIGFRLDNSNTIVLSDGTRYCQPDTTHLEMRIRKFQNNNSEKYRIANKKLSNVLNTFYDQSTIDIIKRNSEAIIIEDNFAQDIKSSNEYINYGVTHASIISKMIIYKAKLHNIPVYIADKKFKSSYICSKCGQIRKSPLERKRIFKCENPYCGLEIDRDLNASINLENLYNFRNYPFNYNHMIKDIIV